MLLSITGEAWKSNSGVWATVMFAWWNEFSGNVFLGTPWQWIWISPRKKLKLNKFFHKYLIFWVAGHKLDQVTQESNNLRLTLELRFPQQAGSLECSVQFSCSVVSDSLWPHGLQHTHSTPVLHHLPELAQTRVHWVDDAIQPSHPPKRTYLWFLSHLVYFVSHYPEDQIFMEKFI